MSACIDCNILALRWSLAAILYRRSRHRLSRLDWCYMLIGIEWQMRAHENEAHPKGGEADEIMTEKTALSKCEKEATTGRGSPACTLRGARGARGPVGKVV